ncbi:MAG TPA: type III secretion system chaperone [Caulifigura sp.]|nr:type III secretion system chaperone [Caulifigura sp.]
MTPAEHLRQLLTEIGPALDLEGVSEFDDGTFVIVRDDDSTIYAELTEDGDVLVLSSELGTPDEECRLATFETALIANYSAASPSSPRIGLAGRNGPLQAVKPLEVSSVDFERLKGSINELFRLVDQWRNVMSRGGVAPQPIVVDAVEETAAVRV